MVFEGELECDHAIFADTGWEPSAVYDHLDGLKAKAEDFGLPLHVVQDGDIRDVESQKEFYDAPYFIVNPDGSHGMAKRQCTSNLKIKPIRRKIRELMEESGHTIKGRPAVIQYLGISWDEIQRMKPADVKFIEHTWPLIDRRWTRSDCLKYLAERGIDAPRSACIGCPFHSNAEWRRLKEDSPAEFADAVQFEKEVQNTGAGLRGKPFLHAARIPLDEVDLRSAEDLGQLNFDAECEGMCGI